MAIKVLILLYLSVLSIQVKAQKNIAGFYYDHFGSTLTLKPDATFKYDWGTDLENSWSSGTWRIHNDTIYFKVIPVYDTMEYKDQKTNMTMDSLILALDDTARLITRQFQDFDPPKGYTGPQNSQPMYEKLVYKKVKYLAFKRMAN